MHSFLSCDFSYSLHFRYNEVQFTDLLINISQLDTIINAYTDIGLNYGHGEGDTCTQKMLRICGTWPVVNVFDDFLTNSMHQCV